MTLAERAAAPRELRLPTAGRLSWRPLDTTDAAALLDLANTVNAADATPYRWSLEEIAEELAEPWLDLTRDSLLGRDSDGVPRAWALLRTTPGDRTVLRVTTDGGVHPDRRGEGIGTELLAWAVGRARQLLADSGRDLPGAIRAYAEDEAPAEQHELFRSAGFRAGRYFSELCRDLAEPIPEITPERPLRLIPWTPELDEPTRLAHNDAFRDHWGSQPRSPEQWTSGRAQFAPLWSFVVVDDHPPVESLLADPDTDPETGRALRAGAPLVVAYHLGGHYPADFEVRGYRFGFSELLGVRRAYRGRRLAPSLLAAALHAFAADGMDRAALGVDDANPTGAAGLYAALGYRKERGSVAYLIEV
ncbi:MAG: GNAT family N-acetyltransferase [Propionicimonas sp.]